MKVTDDSGNIVWQVDYEPFGEVIFWSMPPPRINNNFRLPGQYHDPETGLYYNMHRYYWPNTGRYITPDPLNLSLKGIPEAVHPAKNLLPIIYNLKLNTQDQNLYGYAQNNPLRFIDRLGLSSCEDVFLDHIRKDLKSELICTGGVLGAATICFEGAAMACLPSGPLFPGCFGSLSASCVTFGAFLKTICIGKFTADIIIRYVEYVKCKKCKKY